MDANGLEAVFLANRDRLIRFLRSHGAGEAAEDLLQDVWIRVRDAHPGPLGQPLAYLYRIANNLMLDRFRSERQAVIREREWTEVTGSDDAGRSDSPSTDRLLAARQELDRAHAALAALGPRIEQIFRRHRLDGIPQRILAQELGISVSTVESDLRKAAAAMIDLKRSLDQGPLDPSPS